MVSKKTRRARETSANVKRKLNYRLAWIFAGCALVAGLSALPFRLSLPWQKKTNLQSGPQERRTISSDPSSKSKSIPSPEQPPGSVVGRTDSSNAAPSVITPQILELPDPDKAIALVEVGNKFLNENKFSEAVQAFAESVRLQPEDEDAHFNLAFALGKLGSNDMAKAHYTEALRILPDYAEAHNNLGNLLNKEGNSAEAVEHFKKALEVMPEHASAHNNLGTALARQGKLSESIPHFQEALRITPDYVEARQNLAQTYLAQGRFEEAIQQFKKVLQIQPTSRAAGAGLAKAREKLAGR